MYIFLKDIYKHVFVEKKIYIYKKKKLFEYYYNKIDHKFRIFNYITAAFV